MTATVSDNPERHRFEVQVDGELAGFAVYRLSGSEMTLTHTEVDDAYEGQGLAGQLARAALDAARRNGARIVPQCAFIAAYIERHPEYADLVGTG